MLIEELRKKKASLIKILSAIERNAARRPDGKLWCSKKSDGIDYYIVDDSGKLTYISRKDTGLISALAQKEYDEKMQEECERELSLVDRLIEAEENKTLSTKIDELNYGKRKWAKPYVLSGEEFRAKWESEEYKRKEIRPGTTTFETMRGESVRSKSEKIIADYLYSKGIPYKYERATMLPGGQLIYADFTVLNVRTGQEYILEHFGIMDNPEYAAGTVRKINTYIKNGYLPGDRLIVLFESSQFPLNQEVLEIIVKKYFM
ncbi:MAG: hypothetical protein IJU01_01370 [Lachnospiraceae bacterium]|nr:hypothetical protein [Lachnospiraceae bacterium]